jgi:hypothetical protein
MQLQITRLTSDDRSYSVITSSGNRYGIHDFELKQLLLNLGVGVSAIAAILDIDPNETMTVEVAEAA